MTEPIEPRLLDIVRVLSHTYTDTGVLIWLNAKNKQLRSKPDGNFSCTPMDYIKVGRTAEVYAVAQRIDGGAA